MAAHGGGCRGGGRVARGLPRTPPAVGSPRCVMETPGAVVMSVPEVPPRSTRAAHSRRAARPRRHRAGRRVSATGPGAGVRADGDLLTGRPPRRCARRPRARRSRTCGPPRRELPASCRRSPTAAATRCPRPGIALGAGEQGLARRRGARRDRGGGDRAAHEPSWRRACGSQASADGAEAALRSRTSCGTLVDGPAGTSAALAAPRARASARLSRSRTSSSGGGAAICCQPRRRARRRRRLSRSTISGRPVSTWSPAAPRSAASRRRAEAPRPPGGRPRGARRARAARARSPPPRRPRRSRRAGRRRTATRGCTPSAPTGRSWSRHAGQLAGLAGEEVAVDACRGGGHVHGMPAQRHVRKPEAGRLAAASRTRNQEELGWPSWVAAPTLTEIDAPIAEVWAVVEDVLIAPEWQGGLDSMTALETDDEGRATLVETENDIKVRRSSRACASATRARPGSSGARRRAT